MNTLELRKIIREEIILSQNNDRINEELINESISDFVAKVKLLAAKYAKKYFNSAVKHLNVDAIKKDNPKNVSSDIKNANDKIVQTLKKEKNKIGESSYQGFLGGGLFGSMAFSLANYMPYIGNKFEYWFRSNVLSQAQADLEKLIAIELPQMQSWLQDGKFFLGIFFIFIVLYLIEQVRAKFK